MIKSTYKDEVIDMALKEDQHTEFKEKASSGTIINEIVAFLNTCDGSIYVGVRDDGTIVGVSDIDKTSLNISNIIADQIEPSPRGLVSIETPVMEGRRIVRIDVKKGEGLYYIKKYGMSSAGCFERIGTSSRGMTTKQIKEKYVASLNIPERTMVEIPCNRGNLSFSKFKVYLSAKGVHYNEDFFEDAFHLKTSEGKYNLLADLLADENMTSIKVATFKGNNKVDFLKRNEYGFTCILYAMDQVRDYCLALNDTYIDVSHFDRKEKKMFDEDAFREAWINAVVHNKWVDGIPPAVYWYDDRLEVVSYGRIPEGMTKAEFLAGKSNPVNNELMQIFLQCHIVEQTGHGVPKIVEKYGPESYDFGTFMITVTIPFDKNDISDTGKKNATVNVGVNVGANVGVKLTKTEQNVLKEIEINQFIGAEEISNKIKVTKRTVERSLKSLKEKDLLMRVGPDKGGHWEIKKQR